MKKSKGIIALISLCAVLIMCVAIQSGLASEDKDGKGRIAAVVGARANAGTGYVWKLAKYDKDALDLKWSGFQCDKDVPKVGCSGTFIFVFMPKKLGKSEAILEYYDPKKKLMGRLEVNIEAEKLQVTVNTVEIRKDK